MTNPADTPNIDRFTPEVRDVIRRSYEGSAQQKADQRPGSTVKRGEGDGDGPVAD